MKLNTMKYIVRTFYLFGHCDQMTLIVQQKLLLYIYMK